MLHIILHVGHHFGTCYHHVSLRCCILLDMLFINVGHDTTPHELKMLHIISHVGHHSGTCYPPHELKMLHYIVHVGHQFGTCYHQMN